MQRSVRRKASATISTTPHIILEGVCPIGFRLLAVGLVTLLTPNISFAQEIYFGASTNIDMGAFTHFVAIGDLNGDGKFDLVVGRGIGVYTLLGVGDGTFGPATSIGSGASFGAIGEFNGDGNLDVVASGGIFLGDGTGSFGPAQGLWAGSTPSSIAIGDLNRDGKPDLAVAYGGTAPNPNGTVAILLGAGGGLFGAATQVAAGMLTPSSIAIGDLNRDGKPDLAVTYSAFPVGKVAVFLGEGDGTFGAATDFATGPGPTSVVIGDLNRDGVLDLVTANTSFVAGFTDHVSVLLGIGDGTFGAATHFAGPTSLGGTSSAVAIGDLNADGIPDLVTANTSFLNQVSVLRGYGDGTFHSALNFDVSSVGGANGLRDVAMKDLDGDGKLDLVTADGGHQTVSIVLSTTRPMWRGGNTFLVVVGVIGGLVFVAVMIGRIRNRFRP